MISSYFIPMSTHNSMLITYLFPLMKLSFHTSLFHSNSSTDISTKVLSSILHIYGTPPEFNSHLNTPIMSTNDMPHSYTTFSTYIVPSFDYGPYHIIDIALNASIPHTTAESHITLPTTESIS